MRSAGCCVNDVADRDFDRHVKRTAQRPVTSGAVSVKEALVLGAVLALAGLRPGAHHQPPTVLWSFAALAITLIYPFAKRFVSMPQAVLGIAFSFGIPMAFAAVQATCRCFAWVAAGRQPVLGAGLRHRVRDGRPRRRPAIGMKTSAITFGRFDVAAVMASYAIFLAIWGWAGASRTGWAAVLCGRRAGRGAGAVALALIRDRTRDGCFKAFRLNHWLGFTVFAGIVAGYAVHSMRASAMLERRLEPRAELRLRPPALRAADAGGRALSGARAHHAASRPSPATASC
jgi:4-hydroxybenzoate polyprenyltransferase